MKNTFHNLKAVDSKIKEVLSEIKTIEILPFFKIFNRNESKEMEIHVLRLSLHEYYSAKHAILENMEREIRNEKIRLSAMMRENSISKVG